MNRRVSCIASIVLCWSTIGFSQPTQLPQDCYLFTSFRGNGDGLHLAWSTDGLNWNALAGDKRFLTPTIGPDKLMRDPCILQSPDGMFHMVWTTGWWDHVIGYANSKDLIHWSEQKAIPVMENEPTAQNSWAPELAYDPATSTYIIFWATTIPGRFTAGETTGDKASNGTMLNHRIYCTTTKDFQSFTPTKLYFDPGFSSIDATMVRDSGKYYLVFKDETLNPVKKHLLIASGETAMGPFKLTSDQSFTPDWVEGPTVMKIGDWYYCYFDMYIAHKYGAMRSKDLKTWEDVTPQLKFNVPDIRHGTAFKVSKEILSGLMNAEKP
jgi:Glycosyl hydrolases family 43